MAAAAPSSLSRFRWLTPAALILVCGVYLTSFISGDCYKLYREPPSYYGMLTDALLSGQLSLKVLPDPRLAQLANPYLSYQGIPRMHDATYYKGKYYIYFGVAPVIVLFGPWRLVTGTYLSEAAGTQIFAFVGFLLGLLILRAWRRRQPDGLAPAWTALGIVLWGLGTYFFTIAQTANFYAVPILGAFMMVMIALFATLRMLSTDRPGRAAGWLALASAAWGLAVACRPHYVFSLPLLAFPAAWLLGRDRGRRPALVAALLVPAAVVGALLAEYNYARFGSVTEFGFHYQFTGGDQRFIQMWNPQLILPNIRSYLFQDGIYTIYYPFFTQLSLIQGAFVSSPFAALGLLFPLTLLVRRRREDPAWTIVGLMALAAGLIHLLALSVLPIGTDRYDVDFDPEFSLAAGGTALALFTASHSWRPLGRRLVRGLIGVLAVAAIAKCLLQAGTHLANARLSRGLAVLGNAPVGLVQQALGGVRGPIKLELSFNRLKVGESTNLIETGGGRDSLFVQRVDAIHVRLGFVHLGNAATYGPPFEISRDGHQVVIADMGSLYPPDTHPFFSTWSRPIMDAVRQRISVTLDGRPAFTGYSNFYSSDPFHTTIGEVEARGLQLAPFPGPIYKVSHLRIPDEAAFVAEGWHGAVRLRFKFPAFDFTRTEPLLATGGTQNSDLIYVTYLGRGRARFGHDSNGGGSVETSEVTFDPAAEHTLDIALGSLEAPPGTQPPDKPGLRLAFDGKRLISLARQSHPSQPYQVMFGYNAGHMTESQEAFSGAYLRPEPAEFPPFQALPGSGPLEVQLRFAPMPAGRNEPLVVSGVTGRGDIIYVHYLDSTHAQIGLDHWAVGARLSEPFELRYDATYTLRVTSAAFLPPSGAPGWGTTTPAEQARLLSGIRVALNKRELLAAPWPAYPATPDQVTVGSNSIGGSTTQPTFSGKVVGYRRVGMPGGTPATISATRGADTDGTARP